MVREEELERAAAMMAYIVVRHGPRYAPIFDFLATELERMRADGGDPVERARRYLQNHSLMAIKGSRAGECDAEQGGDTDVTRPKLSVTRKSRR